MGIVAALALVLVWLIAPMPFAMAQDSSGVNKTLTNGTLSVAPPGSLDPDTTGNSDEPLPAPMTQDDIKESSRIFAKEPVWPKWTAVPEPKEVTNAPPIDEYTLVKPANGLFQGYKRGVEDQTYVQQVDEPQDLDYHEATVQLPIDLTRPDGMAPSGVFNANTLSRRRNVPGLLSLQRKLVPGKP